MKRIRRSKRTLWLLCNTYEQGMATEGFLGNIEETGRVWLRIDMRRTHCAKQCLNRRSAGVSCCSTHSIYRTITARPPEAARASSL